jgi:elongation factor G
MVSYYETVTGTACATHLFDRELGGKRHWARVTVEVAPRKRGSGHATEVVADALRALDNSETLRACLDQGLLDGILTGVLARCPMTDVLARVKEVAIADEEMATDVAFRTAAVMAFREAAQAAHPELLEPIMCLDIVTPPEACEQFAKGIRSNKVIWLDDCGHAPMIERPNEFTAALTEYVKSLP